MKINFYNVFFIFNLFGISTSTAGGINHPASFNSFFMAMEENVVVSILGDRVGLKIKGIVSYDEFKIKTSDDDIYAVKNYLQSQQISIDAIDGIVSDLIKGVPANPGCSVSLDVCTPDVSGNDIAYVFDYDNSRLRIFVGSKFFTKSPQDISYHPSLNQDNALINQSSIYSYADGNDSGVEASVSNITTLGLPLGYMQFDTQYQTNHNSFDIYRGTYEFEVAGTRTLTGYRKNSTLAFNTTDFLSDDARYDSYFVQVGSSRNLVRGGNQSLQELPFFSTQSGQLEVYQGQRLLLSRVVSEGRQSILYSELPSGTYDVRILLKSGGEVVAEEFRQVINTRDFSLPVNSVDYVVSLGSFDDSAIEDSHYWQGHVNDFEREYAQGRISWRVNDNALLAMAATATQREHYLQLGGKYLWQDWLNFTYQGGFFDSGDRYNALSLGLGSVYLSMRHFDNKNDTRAYRLSSQLYGDHSFTNYNATYSTSFLGGNGYVSYTSYGIDSPIGLHTEMNSERGGYQKGENINAGWVVPFMGGQLGLNTSYVKYSNRDDLVFNLYWSHSIGDALTGQIALSGNGVTGINKTETSLTHNMSKGHWSGSTALSTASGRDDIKDVALTGIVNGNTDWFNLNTYGYFNSTGQKMLSNTLTGAQIISSESGLLFTSERSSSFMHVAPQIKNSNIILGDPDIDLENIQYHVRRGKSMLYNGNLQGESTIVPLSPYTETEFSLDGEHSSINVDNSFRKEFIYPGTVYNISPIVKKVTSKLFVLSDIFNNPIQHVKCIGSGCGGIERVSDDGVFRISYSVGEDIKLTSMNRVCLVGDESKNNDIYYSYCLPGLDGSGEIFDVARSKEQGGDGVVLYLGKFNNTSESESFGRFEANLKKAGLIVHSVDVGRDVYLYIEYKEQLTLSQRQLLDKFDVYIVRDSIDSDELFSAR